MPLIRKPGTAWEDGYAHCRETAPEAFHDERRYGNVPTHANYPEV